MEHSVHRITETDEQYVCSLCLRRDVPKLYFLPCLHVLCNKCLATQIQQCILDVDRTKLKASDKNKERTSTFDDGVYFEVEAKQNLKNIFGDDDKCEGLYMKELDKNKSKTCSADSEGYEIPQGSALYQNTENFQNLKEIETFITQNEGSYEEVNHLKIHQTNQESDGEIFEEINISKVKTQTSYLPPKPSFRRKPKTGVPLITEPERNPDIMVASNYLTENESVEEKLVLVNEDTPKGTLSEIQCFECPLCRHLCWMSGDAEIINSIPFSLKPFDVKTTAAKSGEILKLLNDIPYVCVQKFCRSSNKSRFCASCGKVLCEVCSSQFHGGHCLAEMKSLAERHRALVESYVDVHKNKRCYYMDMVNRWHSDVTDLAEAKTRAIEALKEQKMYLIGELEKLFKERVNALERSVSFETVRFETSISSLNNHLTKINHFVNFSEAFLRQENLFDSRLEVVSSIAHNYWLLEQFKVPESNEANKISIQTGGVGKDLLSGMLGDVFLNRKSSDAGRSSEQVSEGRDDREHQATIQLDAVEKVPPKMNGVRRNSRRLSRIFKRSSRSSKQESSVTSDDRDYAVKEQECAVKERDYAVKQRDYAVPDVFFNLQLVSDEEECTVVDFATSASRHIVALDSTNRRLKVLNLTGDSFQVVQLRGTSEPRKVSVLEDHGELRFVVAQNSSNCIKIFNNCGREVRNFGHGYLLSVSGIATNSLMQIFVADTTHRKVFVHDGDGKFLFSFPRGTKHGSNKNFNNLYPIDIKINPTNDDIFIFDGAKRLYLVFDKVGIYLFQLSFDSRRALCPRRASSPLGTKSTGNDKTWKGSDRTSPGSKSPETPGRPRVEGRSNLTFDSDGCIYKQSSLEDQLCMFDSNGKFLNEIQAQHLKSCILIAVLDCPIKFRSAMMRENETLSIEKCIVSSKDGLNINVFRLGVPCADKETSSKPKSTENVISKDSSIPVRESVDCEEFENNESGYLVMTGKKHNRQPSHVAQEGQSMKHGVEHLYSTIEDGFDKGDAEMLPSSLDKKSKRRFSERFKKKFFKNKGTACKSDDRGSEKL